MTREELIQYWLDMSEHDAQSMQKLYDTGNYVWSLFVGHLSTEKLLKAVFLKLRPDKEHPPRIHDLESLADKAGLTITVEDRARLNMITDFNIEARYAEDQLAFYKKCTKKFAGDSIITINEVRQWLLTILGF